MSALERESAADAVADDAILLKLNGYCRLLCLGYLGEKLMDAGFGCWLLTLCYNY
jgi:hypothetical protein